MHRYPGAQEAIEINKGESAPAFVLEAMARSISPDVYKAFTARYTKDIALEVSCTRKTFAGRKGFGGVAVGVGVDVGAAVGVGVEVGAGADAGVGFCF